MSIKHTGQELTCVRLIPTISDDRLKFLTTDASGHVSIYEKLANKSHKSPHKIGF